MVTLYLLTLLIAPQLWLEPFKDLPTDYIIVPVWLVVAAFTGALQRKTWTTFDTLFGLFIVQMFVSGFITGALPEELPHAIQYVKYFLLCRLTIASLADMKGMRRFVLGFAIMALVLGVESVQHKFSVDGLGWAGQKLGWIDPSVLRAGGNGRTRWVGIWDGPGVFCVAFTIALGFLLTYVQKPHARLVRYLAALMVLFDLVATYYTGSRGGLLATIAAIGTFVMMRQPNLSKMASRFAWLLPGVFMIFMLAPSYLTNMDDESNSASHRVDMWAEGIDMVTENPVFGIGLGQYRVYTGSLIAHNSAVQVMGEMGLPGIFLWMSLAYVILKRLWQLNSTLEPGMQVTYVRGLFVAVVGYIVSAMFVTLEYETYYILLGGCIAMIRIADVPIEFNRNDAKTVSMIVVGWYVFLKIFVMSYV